MTVCPVCQSPTLRAEDDHYCARCAAAGREPLVSRMGPGQTPPVVAERAVRGSSEAVGVSRAGRPSVQTITMQFPLPPRGCSPNLHAYGHWAIPAKANRGYKAECLACLPRVDYMFAAATISTEWFMGPEQGRYHPQDAGNAIAAIKSLVDAIIEAGYLPDDNARVLAWGETILRTRKESGGVAGVRVTLARRETTAK